MRRKGMACLAAVLACALGGCGTFVNCTTGREIYGGFKQDLQNGSSHLAEAYSGPCPSFSPLPDNPSAGKQLMTRSFCAGCGVGMLAIDLPISLVADTLTLPVTIPATMMKSTDKRKRPRRPATPKPATQPKTIGPNS